MTLDAATRARLVGVFVAEAEETVSSLRGLEGRLGSDADARREFGRMAHGLKGAAASLGYDHVARGLHALESLALGVASATAEEGPERLRRVAGALEHLGEGVARMAASGRDAFPDDVLGGFLAAVGLADVAPTRTREASAPDAQGRGNATPADAAERISVPAGEVDAALRLASALARGAAQMHEAIERGGADLGGAAQALAASAATLEGVVASLRLVPAETALSGLEEEVRELAGRLGKRVTASITGREVRADRRTLQAARGMIRHLVRNALDHGLESEVARTAAGKPPDGKLSVAVALRESILHVTVCDDGAGFDAPAIRRELARRNGSAERIGALSDDEVLRLWAFEGGSTRETATEISGRGLGLSAVARTAREAGGGLTIRSVVGEGSLVEFTLPLEIYAVEVLVVGAGARLFGIPLAAVERTVHLAASRERVHEGPTGRTVAVGETIVPLCSLREALGISSVPSPERFAVVVRSEGVLVAVAVEDVGAVHGVVPATVGGVARSDALVSGVARLVDGSAIAILHPRLLLDRARSAAGRVQRDAAPAAPASVPAARSAAVPRALDVVLAEDSLATREVLRVLLEEQGFQVRVAADGDEALQRVSERPPDVVVSDVNMPRRDGISLTRALRAQPGTERLPVVLLTSRDDDATRAAGVAAGADAYLVKARFNAAVLAETLARLGVTAR